MESRSESRPFDVLNSALGKRVIIDVKNGKQYQGTMKAFDPHINITLSDAEEHKDGQLLRKLGTVFLRGDAIMIITPA